MRFAPGVLGNARALRLSPQHRVLWRHAGQEVLVPAKAFVGQRGVRKLPAGPVSYLHLLFADHQIIRAEGAAVETLFPGPVALDVLSAGERAAIRPLLRTNAPPARPLLCARHFRTMCPT